jgi:hypothetical protein
VKHAALGVAAAAALIGAHATLAQEPPPGMVYDVGQKAALAADISGSPPARPTWLKFWPQFPAPVPPPPPGGKPPSRDPHDLNGSWFQPFGATWFTVEYGTLRQGARADGLPPYKPDAEKIFNYYLKSNADGRPIAESGEYCRPEGIPRVMTFPSLQTILQKPDRIWQIFGQRQRVIYLNQEHPKDLKPTYMGHSVGRWEGDTLVVDTIGFKTKTMRLDRVGSPYGPRLHVTELWTKSDDGSYIDVDAIVDDPDFYTQPFTIRLKLLWRPGMSLFGGAGEGHCEDNPQFIVKGVLYQGVPPPEDHK